MNQYPSIPTPHKPRTLTAPPPFINEEGKGTGYSSTRNRASRLVAAASRSSGVWSLIDEEVVVVEEGDEGGCCRPVIEAEEEEEEAAAREPSPSPPPAPAEGGCSLRRRCVSVRTVIVTFPCATAACD